MSLFELLSHNNPNMQVPFLKKTKKMKATNFFDLTSGEREKIIRKAVQESTKEQVELLKKHGYAFNFLK